MKRVIMTLASVLILSSAFSEAGSPQAPLYPFNRYPLTPKPYAELPIGAVKPSGWLKDQLERMASGLTGHLDEVYPLMGERNGWLGGDGDMWERGPYWIDGLLPLAYILDDKDLQAKTQKWVEWTLSSQREDGFFGPSVDLPYEEGLQRGNTQDWWPRMVVLKFMKQYYDATGDERVITFMDKYFRYQLKTLPSTPLRHWTFWGAERGGDNLYIVYWLYNLTGEKYLLDLGDIIAKQTVPWKKRLSDGETLFKIGSLHCVNLAQGLKEPVIRYQATGDKSDLEAVETGQKELRKGIGWPTGLYGADEMLHSGDPTQGSEFCSAVEMMFSLEKMVEITGRTDWADWLERVAFNALPTQATDDFDSRQYFQQCNQVEITRHVRNFITDHDGTDVCFGPLTGYPCCTSNMHQGWPKFTRNLWFSSIDNGLAAMVYSPSEVTASVGDGVSVKITEGGNYPFDDRITFDVGILTKKVKSVDFPLYLRIPGWCKEASITVNGELYGKYEAGKTACVERSWSSGDRVELNLPMEVTISRWHEASATVERGPLVYALKVGEQWNKVQVPENERTRYGSWYYEVLPTTPWNWGLRRKSIDRKNIGSSFTVVKNDSESYPWNLENAPVEIHVRAARVPSWTLYNGSAGPLPYNGQVTMNDAESAEITLIPYGCTTLRVTEFPVVNAD